MNIAAILALAGLACYAAVLYVVISSPVHTRGRVRRLFAGSLIIMLVWQISAVLVSLARRESVAFAGYQAMSIAVVAFGVSYALFVRTFLMLESRGGLAYGGTFLLLLTSALVILARPSIIESVYWSDTARFYLPRFGPLAALLGIPYYLLLGYAAYLLLRGYRRAQQPIIRNRIQYLLLGWCILLLGTLANFIPPLKNYPIDLLANVVNAVLITYTIFRYQLLDISLVIRKGLAYTIPTTVIAVVYFLIVFLVEKLLRNFVGYQVALLSLLVAALTALAAQPLKDRAQLWVDRLFFREKHDAQRMLRELSESATTILDIEKLTSLLLESVTSTMHVKQACIFLLEAAETRYTLVAQRGKVELAHPISFRDDHPMMRWMATHKETLTRYDLDVIPQLSALWATERDELQRIEAELFIPLVARGQLIGALVLGPKLSEIPYSQDEQLTLSTLANQVAVAIENARLFGEAQAEIAERRRAEMALRESQRRYRSLFEESPIALWEEDLSAVKRYLSDLHKADISDLRAYLAQHLDVVRHLASLVRVVRVNKATLQMYEADNRVDFVEGLNAVIDETAVKAFIDGVIAIDAGERRYQCETTHSTLAGNQRHVDLRWSVAPGFEETLSMVLVSTMDVSERKEREATLRRRTARLELLRDIDEAILESRSLEATIELALRQTRDLLACGGAGWVTLGNESHRLSLITATERTGAPSSSRATASPAPNSASSPPTGPAGSQGTGDRVLQALLDGKIQVVDDLAALSQPSALIKELRALGYRSTLLAPVLRREPGLVDTLVLMDPEAGAFNRESVAVGHEVAHSLALAVRHTEMRREIRERALALERQLARVNLFNEITRAIAARHNLESILRIVAQRLEESFTDRASVWLLEDDHFTLAAEGGWNDETAALVGEPDWTAVLASIPDVWAFRQGRPAYLPSFEHISVAEFIEAANGLGVGSAVVVPLTVDDQLFGVIVSARREQDAFSRAERDFLDGLGEHVALAIHQTQLHENLESAYHELRETQETMMQQERLRALGEMASGIAHDINNAISPIPLYTGLIETRGKLDDRAKTYLETIRLAIRDVEETVGRMRQFYRRRDEAEFSPVDLNAAVQQAVDLTRPRWRDVPQEKGVTIEMRTDFQENLALVAGNDGEIRQAVTNIILNAVDAMPEGGTLTLRTYDHHGSPATIVLDVSDTGVGMSREIQERAFEPFFSTKGERGSGMGLATVYGTMQRHGGEVELRSAPNEGTTLRLIFPAIAMAQSEVPESELLPLDPLHILVIDDERLLRQALKEALESQGHVVTTAEGGISGLAAFQTAIVQGVPFDVVITDLGMPHVDGRKVTQTVKAAAPDTPVILLTGWGQRIQAEDDIPAGVDLVLSKPAGIEDLNRALAQVTTGVRSDRASGRRSAETSVGG